MSNKTTKVLFVINDIIVGGAQKLILDLLNNFDKTKLQCKVICLYYYGYERETFEKEFISSKIQVIYVSHFNCKNDFTGSILKLRKFIKEFDPDVLHLHLPNSVVLGTIASLGLGIKRVVHEHQAREMLSWKLNMLMNLCARLSDKNIFYTNSVELKTSGTENVVNFATTDKLDLLYRHDFTILNGVEVGKISKEVQNFANESSKLCIIKEFGISNNEIVITSISRLIKWKGQEHLIHAFKIALDTNPNLCLLIVGDGPDKDNLTRVVRDYKIEKKVKFLGSRKDITKLLSITHVYCSVFQFERGKEAVAISINSFEAMAANLPVIIGAGIDSDKYIVNNISGCIVDPKNRFELAQRIVELSNDQSMRMSLGSKAFEFVSKNLDVSTVAKVYEDLYEILTKE